MTDEPTNEPKPAAPPPEPLSRSDRALEIENADLKRENERLRAAASTSAVPLLPARTEETVGGGADPDEEDVDYLLGDA
jgi:hypothetical protein